MRFVKSKYYCFGFLTGLLISCNTAAPKPENKTAQQAVAIHTSYPVITVLGTAQDAGAPHIACKKECCALLFNNPEQHRKVVSLGLIDPKQEKKYLFEATPDISVQLRDLSNVSNLAHSDIPDGIFLTHAHIGHYTGLMYLGKEATNTKETAVYAMPKMKAFLTENGPWSQLVTNPNIVLNPLQDQQEITLSENLSVVPFTVPHRDEYSETVGYTISGPRKKVLFIPDINKWELWDKGIVEVIAEVDYAFVDASFYDGSEINNRDISTIPHPFVIESMALFKNLSATEKDKIYFIHFNHTNPLLNPKSQQYKAVIAKGFHVAQEGAIFEL